MVPVGEEGDMNRITWEGWAAAVTVVVIVVVGIAAGWGWAVLALGVVWFVALCVA